MWNPPDRESRQAGNDSGWWGRRPRWQRLAAAAAGAIIVVNASPDATPESRASDTTPSTVVPLEAANPDVTASVDSNPFERTDTTAAASVTTTTSATATPTTATTAAPTPPPSTIPASTTTVSPSTGDRWLVTNVVDGDTVTVELGTNSERLRLIGINSPEEGECYSQPAASRLAELVEGREVSLVSDESDRDQYGRLLRYVYVDDVFVNEVLVREGFAIARRYEPDTAQTGVLEAAQAMAQSDAAGLWAPAACGATAGATIRIGHIRYDADGDDNLNLNDEWVEFVNDGGSADMSDWSVKDESASHRYFFPTGFSLDRGAKVRLHTGCGADTATSLYWCNQGSAVWNNGGDTVFLLDSNGNIAVAADYDG